MDEPVDDVDELAANLRDIALANARLGGTAPVVRAVRELRAVRILDVGCAAGGAGVVGLAVVRDAEERGVIARVPCLDVSEQMLEIARRAIGEHHALAFVRADGLALPYPDRAFDAVTCTLSLHHFEPGPATALLRELRRVAKQ